MLKNNLLLQAKESILQDAIQRDLTTARRVALLEVLWHERYLTREQLIARLELKLGKNCFGASAWKDNFYRDMRVVKQAFKRQIRIYHQLSASERVQQGCSISDTARNVVAYRIRQERPGIDLAVAQSLALERAYSA
jgi:hypothetical protein